MCELNVMSVMICKADKVISGTEVSSHADPIQYYHLCVGVSPSSTCMVGAYIPPSMVFSYPKRGHMCQQQ